MNLWICTQNQSPFYKSQIFQGGPKRICINTDTHIHQQSKTNQMPPRSVQTEKTNLLLLRITKGCINKREGAVDPATESTSLYDLTFLHLCPLHTSSLSLYHTHITSPESSPFSLLFPYFPSLPQMRSSHWFHSSCYGFWGHLGNVPVRSHRDHKHIESLLPSCVILNSCRTTCCDTWARTPAILN